MTFSDSGSLVRLNFNWKSIILDQAPLPLSHVIPRLLLDHPGSASGVKDDAL